MEVSDSQRVINSGGQEAYCVVMSDWRDWQLLKLLYETSQSSLLLSIQRTMQTLLSSPWFCTGSRQAKEQRIYDHGEELNCVSLADVEACPRFFFPPC